MTNLPRAIDHYILSTLARLDRSIAAMTLTVPRPHDPDHGARVIERLVVTLTGLAIGGAVGEVRSRIRRTVGAETALGPLPGPRPAPRLEASFTLQLRARLAVSGREIRALLATIEPQIADRDHRVVVQMLHALADDELVTEKFSHHVRAGWRCAVAAIEGRTIPAADPLWQRWARCLSRTPEVNVPTLAQLARAGTIARIG